MEFMKTELLRWLLKMMMRVSRARMKTMGMMAFVMTEEQRKGGGRRAGSHRAPALDSGISAKLNVSNVLSAISLPVTASCRSGTMRTA